MVLLANEGAGSGTSGDRVAALLRSLGADVVAMPVDEAEGAGAAGPERIAVAGGDGSVAPAAAAAATAGVPLAVIPTGTANDLARRLGLPDDLEAACRLAARGDRLRRLDLGRADGRPFVNAVTAGLSAAAARRARPLKGVLGAGAYMAGAVAAGLRARPVALRACADGREVFEGRAWLAMAACSGAFGAGSHLDGADPGDGVLDLAVVPAGPRVRLVGLAYAMRAGRLSARPEVVRARGRRLELGLGPEAAVNLDGDLAPAPAEVVVEPGAVSVVVG